ncbi:hypothetical protein N24_2919 [Corynebacterium suranareeae]|uniref:Uncharacterized protein n=1 Tax=Corynebacterium suranareeae TaxID=2506452 RepID=A0A169S5U0_9CORY|nr:cytochrome b/b6 domain-containing protein [Corynebacterium suranareeae]BAU97181.1 hypothetical protein N24_2919 [Corynebacterium suranareeae]
MDGTSPQNKNSTTPPAPGNAIPAPGGAIPAPKPTEQEAVIPPVTANPPAPGNAIPAPGGSVPAPGSSVPAPGGSVPVPGASTPSIPTAPGGAVPVPGGVVPAASAVSAPGAPGSAVPTPGAPGSAIPTPGSAVPAPGTSAPGASVPSVSAPGASIPSIPVPGSATPPAPGISAPGSTLPTPGSTPPAPGIPAPGIPAPGIPTPGSALPVPGAPGAPGAPSAPGAPGIPAPGLPTPGVPSAPGAPGIPAPGLPTPGVPSAPGAPTQTAAPAKPVFQDAEKRPRTDEAGNAKKELPLRVRLAQPITRKQWAMTLGVVALGVIVVAAIAVALTKWAFTTEWLQEFVQKYPGKYDLPEGAPVGIPAWLSWQHFFNMFFMVLIIKTGIEINRTRRPKGYWTPKKGGKKISLTLWIHLVLDLLWIINGAIFIILLFATGQWMRIVPTSWDVFPNALSAGLQYVSLDWPTENGWANYNSLQELTYFFTVFIAAPLSIVSGFRMSSYWPKNNAAMNKLIPIGFARALHMPVMVYYIVFICIHVFLVFATGALRNFNHMYAGQDTVNWVGFGWFAASLLVIIAGLVALRPTIIAPVAKIFGQVTAR